MITSKAIAICALAVVVGISTTRAAFADERESKWTALFDGKSLDAWSEESTSPPDEWKIEDGVLSTDDSIGGWLRTRETFGDFELHLDFRLTNKANSGVFLRAVGSTPHVHGLEVQLLDDEAFPDGPNKSACGALMLESGPSERASKPAGQWQTLLIRCEGPKVAVTLNGKQVIDEDLSLHAQRADDHPGRNRRRGYIGLQNRGERVDFRKIEIRELK